MEGATARGGKSFEKQTICYDIGPPSAVRRHIGHCRLDLTRLVVPYVMT